ncbi:methyl-accepting chemotaxis protein [Paenibacillus hexagrammi]|uniref:Methyl-accepting chemotaxis protein n=1 Tax=Paenibacillus hexagrammi TaxID=2908839 RepID=A0ABY3SRF6_9BACL|nr:methyl-accepting chemotaxis protein [Paenibacillus sp. YPD9-1]
MEAARAGEAGKGFAVVAGEIRKLAEGSNKAVAQIQDVTKKVILSVDSLRNHSDKVLQFIDTKVISDYNSMVETGEQYYEDAEFFKKLTNDFSHTAQDLNLSVQNIVRAINEISIAINQSAEGTSEISSKGVSVNENSNDVALLIAQTKESSEKLKQAMQQFII